MPYELHIVRESPITEDEWRSYVERDPAMTYVPELVGRNPKTGGEIRIEGPGSFATWRSGDSKTEFTLTGRKR